MQMFQPSIPQTLGNVVSQSIEFEKQGVAADDVGNVDGIVRPESVEALLLGDQAVAGVPQGLGAVGRQGFGNDEVALFLETGALRIRQAMGQAGGIHEQER